MFSTLKSYVKCAAAFYLITTGIAGCAPKAIPSVQLSRGGNTPVGAMNQFRQAITEGDVASAAGFYFMPEDLDGSCRTALAQSQIAQDQFFRSVETCFGHDAAVQLGARMSGFIEEPLREYTADDFRELSDPTTAVGRIGPGGTWQPLVRPPDGIWRIDEGGIGSEQLKEFAAFERARADVYRSLTVQVNEKQLRDLHEVKDPAVAALRALANLTPSPPPRSPVPPRIPAAILDKGRVQGAIGAYKKAFDSRDKAEITSFFYCEHDPNYKLAPANAERILAALRLKDAVDLKFKGVGESFVSDDTLLLTAPDLIWWCGVEQERGESAIGVFEDNSQVSFRKIDGVWKLDITPPKPTTPEELAEPMKKNSRKLDGITAGVSAGKYHDLSEVRKALETAELVAPEQPAANTQNAPGRQSAPTGVFQ